MRATGGEEVIDGINRDHQPLAEAEGRDLASMHALVGGATADAEQLGDLGHGISPAQTTVEKARPESLGIRGLGKAGRMARHPPNMRQDRCGNRCAHRLNHDDGREDVARNVARRPTDAGDHEKLARRWATSEPATLRLAPNAHHRDLDHLVDEVPQMLGHAGEYATQSGAMMR